MQNKDLKIKQLIELLTYFNLAAIILLDNTILITT